MVRYCAAVLLATLICGQAVRAQNADPSPDLAAELQATIDAYAEDYNAGAIDKVMSHWAENSDFVDIHGEFHEGRDLISALFRRGFADNPGRKISFTPTARKFLSPVVAMDDGILTLTSADGTSTHQGRYTVVWMKEEGKWLIRSARDIPIETPAEEEPVEAETPPLEELAWLVGKWEAKSDAFQIALETKWDLDNSFLVQNFDVTVGETKFRVVKYIAYDPLEGRFRMWFFDSSGGFGGGAWTRRDNQFKATIVSVLPDGQVGSSVMTWEQLDDDTMQWQAIEREVGGASLPDVALKYVRVQ
ncbi:SgcJ/EcaC family oxidoreductase [Blastopirellula sp. JC733]|nr:SgcJ/EcaC family oxidoreductase [Blastopirellula sediminis]